ncbi:MAG TPA: tetratricopeptide repeat protein [Gemmatimonadales bacterium]|jgi:tetratricopeptide (TPR) repeat protein|nr:tetratricopeptide repeat protein [Gemmatimonadales bacterium]
MSEGFRSSDEFDEQAHQLYNEGRYEEAIAILKEGLSLYPSAVELHVGAGYAQLAREEFAWSRRAFEGALTLEPDHEDALAGLGEVLLKLGERKGALAAFERVLDLGMQDDHDLMLQIGRSCFREGLITQAIRFFELAAAAHADSADAAACMGYASHRLGRDGAALYWLRRALELETAFAEARIYIGNMLYDRGESEAALHHFEKTEPMDHFEELGLWRTIELKKSVYRLGDDDPELTPWYERLSEVSGEPDSVDELLAEVESLHPDGTVRDPNQLELFGALLSEPFGMQRRPLFGDHHVVITLSGHTLRGSWDEILAQFQATEVSWADAPLAEFMASLARRGRTEAGVEIPLTSAEEFLMGSAEAGVLRIVQ